MISKRIPKLHDRTRRKICIAAFFAVCVLPTCCLFAWGVSRQSPWHAAPYAQQLESYLGLNVTIDHVEHPRPGVIRYHGTRLCDPETGQVVAVFNRIEARRQDVQDRPLPALVLVADTAQICPTRFGNFTRLLNHIMARRMTRDDVDLRLVIGELKLQADENDTLSGVTTLNTVQGSLQTVENGSQAEFSFRPGSPAEDADSTEPIRIHIRRDRRDAPASICFYIDSRITPLPCVLLALVMPECESLGSNSRFQGYISAKKTVAGWEGCIDAKLTDIDLESLLGPRFPNTLTGQAQVAIHQARFTAGRLQEAKGSIAAGPGSIGREFYGSVYRQLGLDYRDLPSDGNDRIPYDKLALSFTVDHDGLQIKGTVPNQIEPVILANKVESLLGEPKTQPQPISALLSALAPNNSYQVPATKQIQWLSSLLPLPDSAKTSEKTR